MNLFTEAYGTPTREALEGVGIEPFVLQELLHHKWDEITETIGAKRAGRLFAEAVAAEFFPGVIYVGIRRAGRQNEYRLVR